MDEITKDEGKCEIEEEVETSSSSWNHQQSSTDENHVYVAVGKSESSMDALAWTLKHHAAVNASSSTIVFLIHVFPEIQHIPTPLGKLPKSKVSPQQVENYMSEERRKRGEFLQKLLSMASGFDGVKIETMLIESNTVARSIVDLIPVLNITKLVVGSTSKKIKIGKIADQILNRAPDYCHVKIVCKGKELVMTPTHHHVHRPEEDREDNVSNFSSTSQQPQSSSSCVCFFS